MGESIEHATESVFIALMKARPELAGFEIRHREDERAKDKNEIAIGATAVERELAGPRGDRMEVTCEFTGTTTKKEQNDVIAGAMRRAIIEAVAVDELSPFSYFDLRPEEMSGEREEDGNSRIRTITVPALVRLK